MNLYLIGYRGSGKTTVARLVAAKLNRDFVDSDDLIEQQTGQTIAEIFAQRQEAGFRELEQAVIHGFQATDCRVVALGGGAILQPANRNWLANTGKLVWLKGSAQTLWQRIANDASSCQRRPNLTSLGGQSEVQQMLERREPIYNQCCDFWVSVDDQSPAQIADQVIAWWQTFDRLNDAFGERATP